MIISTILLIVGLVLILKGANWLTEGASALAKRLQISDMVVGLTVVAFGTSMPEFVISLFSALRGSSDISIGNIVGSNIFNVLAIVGCTALFYPIAIRKSTLYKDIPFGILSAVVLVILSFDLLIGGGSENMISRADGFILLCFFAVFMAYTFSVARSSKSEKSAATIVELSPLKITLFIAIGLAGLIAGGQLFVDGASQLARYMGISESVIGLTIVAGGTSLPELATSVVAARKGNSEMAIGNVIGSCLFNTFWVLGICAAISPMSIGEISILDMGTMLGSLVLLWFFTFTKLRVSRSEGAIMLLLLIAYLSYLVYGATH